MKKYLIIATLFIAFLGSNYTFAEEAVSTTEDSTTEEVKQLKLEGVNVLGKKKVELEFDSKISDSDKDISIKSDGEGIEEIFVLDYNVSDNKVILVLEDELKSNTEYEVIIFSIEGEDGSTITSGLDGALKFTTPDLTIFDEKEVKINKEEPKQEEVKEEEVEEEEVEMTSAGVEEKAKEPKKEEVKKEEPKNENLAGKDIKQEEVDKNIEVAASKTDELVKTGPEHILLSILALILAALIAYIINQRKNNKI